MNPGRSPILDPDLKFDDRAMALAISSARPRSQVRVGPVAPGRAATLETRSRCECLDASATEGALYEPGTRSRKHALRPSRTRQPDCRESQCRCRVHLD